MRTVILATGETPYLTSLTKSKPNGLLKVADKAIIQHIIEYLAVQGVTHFDIILRNHPEAIEEFLEEGERWGVTLTYHLAKDAETPFSTLFPSIPDWKDSMVLIGNVWSLPALDLLNLMKSIEATQKPILLKFPTNESMQWGLFPTKLLSELSFKSKLADLFDLRPENSISMKLPTVFRARNTKELKESNIQALISTTRELLFPAAAKLKEPGIWISRAATIHPSAKIQPPVFIGENSIIKEGVEVGPNTIIESNCVIDNYSIVKDALVCQHSYIGENLTIENGVIDQSTFINMNLKAHITVSDKFILSDLETPNIHDLILRTCTRIFAFFLTLLFSPFMIILLPFRKIHKHKVLYVPTIDNPYHWVEFHLYSFTKRNEANPPGIPSGFLNSLPLLINIIWGHLHFTGAPPRTTEEVLNLPDDWKRLHLSSQVGIFSLADVELDENASDEEIYASEAFYNIHHKFSYNFKLCLRWLKKKIFSNN